MKFDRIWTKIGTRTPPTPLTNIVVRTRVAKGTWKRDISSQSWKTCKKALIGIFSLIFDQLFEKIQKNASRK